MSKSFNIPVVSLFSFVVVQKLYVTYFDYLKENHLILTKADFFINHFINIFH